MNLIHAARGFAASRGPVREDATVRSVRETPLFNKNGGGPRAAGPRIPNKPKLVWFKSRSRNHIKKLRPCAGAFLFWSGAVVNEPTGSRGRDGQERPRDAAIQQEWRRSEGRRPEDPKQAQACLGQIQPPKPNKRR